MNPSEIVAAVFLVAGCFFYFAGTVGLLRFPDVFSRLHALTKADNLGLMLICIALGTLAASFQAAALLAVIWFLGLISATVSCHLIARHARRSDRR